MIHHQLGSYVVQGRSWDRACRDATTVVQDRHTYMYATGISIPVPIRSLTAFLMVREPLL